MAFVTAALMASVVALLGGEPGSVAGSVKVVQAGYELNCTRVWLIPRSAETDALINAKFGPLNTGVQVASSSNIPSVKNAPPEGTRESRCLGRFSEKFSFTDVAPGDYYLTLSAVPRVRYESETRSGPASIEMMQRVTVTSGSKIKSDFRHVG